MTKKYSVSFHAATAPITEPITKFGGQPVWITDPEWPVSKQTGNPMQFICQIALYPELFGDVAGKVAYVFMTDDEDNVDGTWDPDSGENAVIIQPNGTNVTTTAIATGPTLYRMEEKQDSELLQPIPCEFSVEVSPGDDPERGFEDDLDGVALEETKIGGTPIFLQEEEYPDGEGWQLLLQLDSASAPFYVNFGDSGVGYVFISKDGRSGKFLWQCA